MIWQKESAGFVTGEENPMYESPFPGLERRPRDIRDLMSSVRPTGADETVITVSGRRNRFLGDGGAIGSAVVGFGAYYGAWEFALRNLD